jgi:hypothetical protein
LFYGIYELERLAANLALRCWQCGGQGFESPQLHLRAPYSGAFSLFVSGQWEV